MSLEKIEIKLQRVTDLFNDIPLPEYATEGSSGLDLRAAIESETVIPKGKVSLVPTNLRVEIPLGYEIQIRPRSGLAAKSGIGVLNSPAQLIRITEVRLKLFFSILERRFYYKTGR